MGIRLPEFGRHHLGHLGAGRVIRRQRRALDLAPQLRRHLRFEIPHLVRQASLPQASGQAFLDRTDEPRRPIGAREEGVFHPARFQITDEVARRGGVFLGARHQAQQHLVPLPRDAPRREDRLARLPQVQAFGHAIHEQIRQVHLARESRWLNS